LKLMNKSIDTRVFLRGLILFAAVAVPSLGVGARNGTALEMTTLASRDLGVLPVPAAAVVAEAVALLAEPALEWSDEALGSIDRDVFQTAMDAASDAIASGDAPQAKTLTVIDFTRPSTQKRMWVYDLRTRELLFEELVSHGRGSGLKFATSFSNVPDSNQSSLGLYRTAESYVGSNGYSLRLDGLEAGVNDRARERAIVIHGAPYANPQVAQAQGYLGRSLGCPAVREEVSRELIDTIKGGDLVFAYYPDEKWLRSSSYLNGVAAD
jgi:hypothetical protein